MLLTHWINHNNSHKDNYISWAKKASDGDLGEAASFLNSAAELSVRITEDLEKALKSLDR